MSHRLLSIDGGGVRGVVALEVLARIEQLVRDETGDPELVLGDWVSDTDRRLEETILDLLAARARTATICPSDAARAVGGDDTWRELMEPARRAARRLVASGDVVITQGGRVVDPSTAKGAIRIRRT